MAKSEVSVSMITGCCMTKWARIGAVVNRCLSSAKAASASLSQTHFSVFFVNSVSGQTT